MFGIFQGGLMESSEMDILKEYEAGNLNKRLNLFLQFPELRSGFIELDFQNETPWLKQPSKKRMSRRRLKPGFLRQFVSSFFGV